ncbi:MAG: DNA polymerase III subunit beta [Deltaproteobacteria bacterium]|nr:DNA polymerase III subunit beta [Deltaproteobacteria bacterium]MBN2688165.1 DNA polymerase III subunit beta [Deltaproteobacteria bacterium]
MEFNIDRSTFLESVQKTLGIVERKSTMPILNNLLLKTGDDQITVVATDREVGLVATYEADVVTQGDITIAARKLYEMIREIQGERVNVKKLDNNWMNVTCGKMEFRLPGIPAVDFPDVSEEEGVVYSRIKSGMLREMINKTYFAISTDEMRISLNGVFLKIERGAIEMVATDGHRLSIVKMPLDDGADIDIGSGGIIIPRKGVGEMRKLLEDEDGIVDIGIKTGVCILKKNNTILKMSLIDSDYPDYEKVIPTEKGVELVVNKEDMLHSLRRMGVISSDRFSGVKIQINNNKMVLSSTNTDIGEAHDEVDVIYSGKEFEVGYNVKYLIDAVDVVDEKEISFEMRESQGPAIVREAGNDSFKCIIMPLRL